VNAIATPPHPVFDLYYSANYVCNMNFKLSKTSRAEMRVPVLKQNTSEKIIE